MQALDETALATRFLNTTKRLRSAGNEVPAIAEKMGLSVDDFMDVYTLAEQAVLDMPVPKWNLRRDTLSG